jgi:hypothetical protein
LFFGHFGVFSPGDALAEAAGMVWFFEKETALVICEIRHAGDDESAYEFEISDASGPVTHRFESPTDLITKYLHEQARLMAAGWRPRASNLTVCE